MRKYHYEYQCLTDNLCWGRMDLGSYKTRALAEAAGEAAGKGCYIVKPVRKYD